MDADHGADEAGPGRRPGTRALDVALKSAVHATMTVKPTESVPDLILQDGSRGMNEASRRLKEPLMC